MDINFIIVIMLLGLSVMVLISGVANDAINFLNSAIGSKAASFKTIIIVAGFGIFAGVFASSGMMEIARKGIFHPEFFLMPELMIIYVAAMFQGFILLDTFNTFGLPTSTTVSIVFGLFGAALAMSLIKISGSGESFDLVFQYINTPKVIKIIGAIVLSIVMAFIVGSIIQFITRLIFSFSYKEKIRKFGSIWGGIVLTSLSFFILLKGLKGAEFVSSDFKMLIMNNMYETMGILFITYTVIFQLLLSFTRINILKIIVLVGTFALALAFAANDLVNFIGAPLAGYNAYNLAHETDAPLNTLMTMMSGKVPADNLLLLLAGLIMVVTLFINKKARTVAQTELSLGRQEEGYERFESNAVARAIVRFFISIMSVVKNITPESIQSFVRDRLDVSKFQPEEEDEESRPMFDLIRAAVILMVSAALISYATVNKLPLSTTYVTFIVAMAAALPDKAWGRESAVYRVSGVITVVGGWFFTAIFATGIAMIIAYLLWIGQEIALFGFLGIVVFLYYKTHKLHSAKEIESSQKSLESKLKSTRGTYLDHIFVNTSNIIARVDNSLTSSIEGILTEDLKGAKSGSRQSDEISFKVNQLNMELLKALEFEKNETEENVSIFTELISSVKDISTSTEHITKQINKYVSNQHSSFMDGQAEDLRYAIKMYRDYTHLAIKMLDDSDFSEKDNLKVVSKELKKIIKKMIKNQLKRVKANNGKMRRSMLILNIYAELKNNVDNIRLAVKSFAAIQEVDDFKNIPGD